MQPSVPVAYGALFSVGNAHRDLVSWSLVSSSRIMISHRLLALWSRIVISHRLFALSSRIVISRCLLASWSCIVFSHHLLILSSHIVFSCRDLLSWSPVIFLFSHCDLALWSRIVFYVCFWTSFRCSRQRKLHGKFLYFFSDYPTAHTTSRTQGGPTAAHPDAFRRGVLRWPDDEAMATPLGGLKMTMRPDRWRWRDDDTTGTPLGGVIYLPCQGLEDPDFACPRWFIPAF